MKFAFVAAFVACVTAFDVRFFPSVQEACASPLLFNSIRNINLALPVSDLINCQSCSRQSSFSTAHDTDMFVNVARLVLCLAQNATCEFTTSDLMGYHLNMIAEESSAHELATFLLVPMPSLVGHPCNVSQTSGPEMVNINFRMLGFQTCQSLDCPANITRPANNETSPVAYPVRLFLAADPSLDDPNAGANVRQSLAVVMGISPARIANYFFSGQAVTFRILDAEHDSGEAAANRLIGMVVRADPALAAQNLHILRIQVGDGPVFSAPAFEVAGQEPRRKNMWAWLGPVIAVVAVAALAGVVLVVQRARARQDEDPTADDRSIMVAQSALSASGYNYYGSSTGSGTGSGTASYSDTSGTQVSSSGINTMPGSYYLQSTS